MKWLLIPSILASVALFQNCSRFSVMSFSSQEPTDQTIPDTPEGTETTPPGVDRPPGISIFVSPSGSDSNTSTLDSPLRTLNEALNRLKTYQTKTNQKGGHRIVLLNGRYTISSRIDINSFHSGTESNPNIIQAESAAVELFGGAMLNPKDFAKLDAIKDAGLKLRLKNSGNESSFDIIKKISLEKYGSQLGVISRHGYIPPTKEVTPPMSLLINNVKMTLARWPDSGTDSETAKFTGVLPSPECTNLSPCFLVDYDRPSTWSLTLDLNNIWVVGVFAKSWEWSYNRLKAFNAFSEKKNKVSLSYAEVTEPLIQKWHSNFHHYENIFEELTRPGEYFIDREKKLLFIYPGDDFDNSQISISTLGEDFITVKNAQDIVLRNLTLNTGRSGGVTVSNSTRIVLDSMLIQNVTGHGTSFWNTKKSGIVNSIITNVGLNGVNIGRSAASAESTEMDLNYVRSSDISNTSSYKKVYTPAVSIAGTGNEVRNVKVHNIPHAAIILYNNHHTVENNEISSVNFDFTDMGALYVNSGSSPHHYGLKIKKNYFHTVGKSGMSHQHGVYLDNQTMGATIEKNFFRNFSAKSSAIHLNSASYTKIHQNFFLDSELPLTMSSHSMIAHRYYADPDGPWRTKIKIDDPATCPISCPAESVVNCQFYIDNNRLCYFWEEWNETVARVKNVKSLPEGLSKLVGLPRSVEFFNNLIVNLPGSSLEPSASSHGGFVDEFFPTFSTVQLQPSAPNILLDTDPGFQNYLEGRYGLQNESAHFDDFDFDFGNVGPIGPIGPK
ncbi:MAG: right-handed parallel beta-helix repeat-containing protein [Bdellovibrionaceae bacterium]|nr:right-handed parallel beta-helix repeat-containing protein [Pseudobdellovibrionaceae bacterium]